MVKFFSFVEGQKYVLKNIPQEFIQNNYFSKNPDGTYTVKVCGISNYKNSNYFFFPKGYDQNLHSSQKRETAQMIFQTLLKYKSTVTLMSEESEWLGAENKDSEFLELIDWLFQDFLQNGLYAETEQKLELNGNGRIDWSRTIKQQQPFVKDKQFVYFDVVTRRNRINNNTMIALIHKNIILECIKNFGWLFNIKNTHEVIKVPISKEQQILYLKKKIQEMFVGHDIKLISSLIAYLEKTKGKDSDFNLVTPYFYVVWEEMLQIAFCNDKSLQKLVPKPYWKIKDKKRYTRQIPDILLQVEEHLVIIDAKYYSTAKGELERYPGWESIVKQMYYNISLNHIYDDIQNVFIMPETVHNKNYYKYIGKTTVEGKENQFGYVSAYAVDIDTVLKSYISNYRLNELLREILNEVSEINIIPKLNN